MKFDLRDGDKVSCEQCIHEKVCGKKEYLTSMVLEIKDVTKYSKYSDFTVFIDCEYGSPVTPTPKTTTSKKSTSTSK